MIDTLHQKIRDNWLSGATYHDIVRMPEFMAAPAETRRQVASVWVHMEFCLSANLTVMGLHENNIYDSRILLRHLKNSC